MTWTPRELEMAGAHPRLSYGEIARTYGVTRNQVSGLIYRIRRAPSGRQRARHVNCGRPPVWDSTILALLSDERPRTFREIAARLNAHPNSIYKALVRLERAGVVGRTLGAGNLPDAWKWREDDEDDTAPPQAVYVP